MEARDLTYGVIGLGKFGSAVVEELLAAEHTVMMADKNEETLRNIQNSVNYAYILDSTNVAALKEADFHGLGVAIVSVGENVEKNILTLMALKDIGVSNIIAKAASNIHGQILSKLGATKVVYPEKENAKRLVKEFLIRSMDLEVFDLSSSAMCTVKITIDNELARNSLEHIVQGMHLAAYKKLNSDWEILPNLETITALSDGVMILLDTARELKEFEH